MKKVILVTLLFLGSFTSLSAKYIAGYLECDHPFSNEGSTYFIVKGKGSSGSSLAMAAFLNAEYPNEITKYCESGTIYAHDGYVFLYDSKAEANKHFSKLIREYKGKSFVKNIISISRGYNEDDWK